MESQLSLTLISILLFLAISPNVRAQTSHDRKMMGAPTRAVLTINSFARHGDGGGPSECDGHFHSDDTLIVALSTRWYNHGQRCMKNIVVHGNGRSVVAKVVDECDSSRGCRINIVDGSRAVWKALGVPKNDWGLLDVTWSDA